jgi:hypothetical protein
MPADIGRIQFTQMKDKDGREGLHVPVTGFDLFHPVSATITCGGHQEELIARCSIRCALSAIPSNTVMVNIMFPDRSDNVTVKRTSLSSPVIFVLRPSHGNLRIETSSAVCRRKIYIHSEREREFVCVTERQIEKRTDVFVLWFRV